jgi:hypothetical protein
MSAHGRCGTPYDFYDYRDYPHFKESIGFTKRGCRLSCKFCVVPEKEGKPFLVNSINDIWRGAPYPRKLHLLDNDFFGHDSWHDHIREIIEGNFRVCYEKIQQFRASTFWPLDRMWNLLLPKVQIGS